ncbi:uncharacterized protein LOC133302227 [Gastrolobium bilobum]|uniref:uncharacterized protein LOC133302227 n=1 Tax=Gastrolobium bilobum TaxID=150636 RepID=UPI002AB299DF|nr:uncharacterized protein LOC133302227 [Gastrolobium bilobum]
MMSQQQNPATVSQSLLQQTGSEADIKPFSIRQYVLASRHRSILHSWPFPEKYLQMCLNRGLRDVLPPFGRQTSLAESLKGCSNSMLLRNDSKEVDCCKTEEHHLIEHPQNIKNECDLFSDGERYKVTTNHNRDCPSSHEEGNQHNCGVSVNLSQSADTFTLPSSVNVHKNSSSLALSKVTKDKRRRRRGRCKKRSMVDILAVARHCTLEEIYRMNKFSFTETVIEGCQQILPTFENISKSELACEDLYGKAESADHEVANDRTGKGALLLKFKLKECNVNRNCST